MLGQSIDYVKNFMEDLTWPLRAAVLAAGAGMVAGLLYFAGQAIWWIVGGIVVIILVLVIFELIRRFKKNKQGKSFTDTLKSMLANQPRGASAEDRGRLEQLREKFEEGMETFKAAGRSVYDVPWYMLIGEPGSGKTEAIRRSNIAFPPGIQDPYQGAGGTINMDWWFANDAVIIDTAGRIFIEEVKAGQTAEWDQLLNLLKGFRKRCPINGVMLVLPAAAPPTESDSPVAMGGLIDDTPEQIEARATRFVERIGRIQQRLGVRFPVFVLVTMCDRILGFREFFDDMTDVADQHQMLGWSNPASLDDPYDPNVVQTALSSIGRGLRRHRSAKMRDPVHTEDASKRRADQVDAMFAFPGAFENVFPQLRSYLDKLFTKTAWYQPPFFRGLYFTSSMQKGEAIDKALAELVGGDASELGSGGIFRADRAYFLKDVIEDKVFRERGLVTDAADAEGSRKKTIRVLWVGGAIAAALMLVSMIWGVVCTSRWQRDNLEPWRNARLAYHEDAEPGEEAPFRNLSAVLVRELGKPLPGYADLPRGEEIYGGSTADIQETLLTKLNATSSGLMCRLFGANFGAATSDAQAYLFARSVARPVVTAALEQIAGAEGVEQTEDTGGQATIELLRWSTIALGQTPASVDGPVTDEVAINFENVLRAVKVESIYNDRWTEDAPRHAQVFADTYQRLALEDPSGQKLREWLAFSIGFDDPDNPADAPRRKELLATAVGRALNSLGEGASPESDYGRLVALDAAMTEYLSAEQALWSVADAQRTIGSQLEAERLRDVWESEYGRMESSEDEVVALLPPLGASSSTGIVDQPFAQQVSTQRRDEVSRAYSGMVRALPEAPAEGEATDPGLMTEDELYLANLRSSVQTGQSSFDSGFQSNVDQMLTRVTTWSPHARPLGDDRLSAVERRHVAYSRASDRLLQGMTQDELLYLARMARVLDEMEANWQQAQSEITIVLAPLRDQPALQPSVASAESAVTFARKLSTGIAAQVASEQALNNGWPTEADLRETFAETPAPFVPPTNTELAADGGGEVFDPAYSAEAARAISDALSMMEATVNGENGEGGLLLDPGSISGAMGAISDARDAYVRTYADRWRSIMDRGVAIVRTNTWNDYRSNVLGAIRPVSDTTTLANFRNGILNAASPLRGLAAPGSPAERVVQEFLAEVDNAHQAEINLQGSYPLDRQLRLLQEYLERLPPNTAEARSRILSNVSATELPPVLGMLKDAQAEVAGVGQYRFETRYTTGLLAAAMDAIREETRADLVARYTAFAQAHTGMFPFTRIENANDFAQVAAMPSAQINAIGDFGGIDALLGRSSRTSEDELAIASYPPLLRDAIDRLANLLDISERDRADRLLELRNSLAGSVPNRIDLTCTLSLPSQPQSHRPLNVQCLRVGRSGGQRAPVKYFRFDADVPFTEQGMDQPIQFRADEGLTLALLNTENDPAPQFEFPLGEWGPLKMLQVFNATPVAGPGAASAEWDMRVPLGTTGQYVVVRVIFSRPVPPQDRWPDF